MSSKKGPGRFVAAHQTEAARRALIQPVPCWEYKWVIPQGMNSGSTLRLRQWVKTDKRQEFSDDEDESQVPLAPLPDEPEQEQGDDEEEEEEKEDSAAPAASGMATPLPAETSMQGVPGLDTPLSGALTPASGEPPTAANLASRLTASAAKPHPLSASFVPDDMDTLDTLDTSDQPVEATEAQEMIGDEPSLLDSINMEMGVGMEGMDEGNPDAYMDILNSGDLAMGGDILDSGMREDEV